MKKIAAAAASLGFLATTVSAFAQGGVSPTIGVKINVPTQGISPAISIGALLSNALTIVFVIAALLVLVFLIIGAFQWITSGGDKEAVGKARNRITHALIGLAILALAFLITRVVGQIVNIDILNLRTLPTLDSCPNDKIFDPTTGGCVTPRNP